jgi:hypothetical protein
VVLRHGLGGTCRCTRRFGRAHMAWHDKANLPPAPLHALFLPLGRGGRVFSPSSLLGLRKPRGRGTSEDSPKVLPSLVWATAFRGRHRIVSFDPQVCHSMERLQGRTTQSTSYQILRGWTAANQRYAPRWFAGHVGMDGGQLAQARPSFRSHVRMPRVNCGSHVDYRVGAWQAARLLCGVFTCCGVRHALACGEASVV